jgi:hypothetical protein
MNHSIPGMNAGYVTRHKLLEDHLRSQQQAISTAVFPPSTSRSRKTLLCEIGSVTQSKSTCSKRVFLALNSKSAMEIIGRLPDEDRTPRALDQDRS